MVITARNMQVVRLFSSFTVLSTRIGMISVTRSAAENKADYAIDHQKTVCAKQRVLVASYGSNYYNRVVIAATTMQVIYDYFCHSLCF